MTPQVFWNSSLYELLDYMESHTRRMIRKKREEVAMFFMLADIISQRHPMVDKEKNPVSYPWDYYPELFKEDKEWNEKQKSENEFEDYKSKRRRAMIEHNRARGGGE